MANINNNNNWQRQLSNVSWVNRANSSNVRSNAVNTPRLSNNNSRARYRNNSGAVATAEVATAEVATTEVATTEARAEAMTVNNNAASANSVRRQANLGNAARQRTNPVTVIIDKTPEKKIDDFPETEMILQVLVDKGLIQEKDKKEYDATVTINGATIPINYINTFYDLHELEHFPKEAFGTLEIVVTLIKKRKKWFGLFGGGANGKRRTRKMRRNRRRRARKTSKY